jgi:hypothetical protein
MSDAPRWYVTMWWHAYLPDEPLWTRPVAIDLSSHIEAHADVLALAGASTWSSGASGTLRLGRPV